MADNTSDKLAPLSGTVVSLKTLTETQKEIGLIRPDNTLPATFTHKDVYFSKSSVQGAEICSGDTVFFELDRQTHGKPAALRVWKKGSTVLTNTDSMSKEHNRDGVPQRTIRTQDMFPGIVSKADTTWGSIKSQEPIPERLKGKTIVFQQGKVKGNPCSSNETVFFTIGDAPTGSIIAAVEVWHSNDITAQESSSDSNSESDDSHNVTDDKLTDQPNLPGGPVSRQIRYRGQIVTLSEHYGFLRPLCDLPSGYRPDENIYFSVNECECAGIDLCKGDELEFTLGVQIKDKPRAFKVKLVKCQDRDCASVVKYVRYVHELLRSAEDDQTKCCLQILTCPAVWQCLGNCESLTSEGTLLLIETIVLLDNISFSMESHLGTILLHLSYSKFLHPRIGPIAKYIKKMQTTIGPAVIRQLKVFCSLLVKHVPQKALAVVSVFKPIVGYGVPGLEELLYNTLRVVAYQSSTTVEDMEWSELPMTPTVSELFRGPMENSANLRRVVVKGAYPSVEDYIDIYFRLLRADCFTNLCSGIQSFVDGKLDHRDMNVYHSVRLVGVQETQSRTGLGLAVQIVPYLKITNWETSSCLMFGNLICLSPSGKFKDPIWATVLNRDSERLKKSGVVTIELASECNKMSDADAVLAISNAGSNMHLAESPTYYKAYQPVLLALQNMKAHDIPFQKTLIEVKHSDFPGYLSNSVLAHASASDLYKTLDSSQQDAFRNVLQNEIGIIQGPPGTGKTFIGLKLLDFIFSQKNNLNGPVLILTYKNRALDDLLKDLVIQYPGKIARVGGRSSEPILESCNLNEMRKNHRKSRELFSQWKLLSSEAGFIKDELRKHGKLLEQAMIFDNSCLVNVLSEKQLYQFLTGYDWRSTPVKFDLKTGTIHEKNPGKRAERFHKLIEHLVGGKSGSEIYTTGKIPDDMKTIIKMVIDKWLPSLEEFQKFETQLSQSNLPELEFNEITMKKEDKDEHDVEEEQNERLAVFEKGQKNIKLQNILTFRQNNTSPRLIASSEQMMQDTNVSQLLNVANLWKLTNIQRIQLIQCVLHQRCVEHKKNFIKTLREYSHKYKAITEIENQHKASILQDMKVVGMTITGASIHNELLRQVKPKIVLVEEAAEVLEPHLLAIMGPWLEHLILIGDHKQLRPPVESFVLRKDFKFDISMMERLIENDLPFATLRKQNRMRPEFAELLKDIYPNLENNMERVIKNKAPVCMAKSMFFWHHTYPENNHQGRSYTNEEEIERVLKLTMFFIQQGYSPNQITILAAYQRQTAMIRRAVRQAEKDNQDMFSQYIDKTESSPASSTNKVIVHTIDNFQGDENDILIISLVRSTKPGFLGMSNRRCVAQSRARCGMYFIGNKETLSTIPHWNSMLTKMETGGHLGEIIELCCPLHPNESKIPALNSKDITLGDFCKKKCREYMSCGIHPCGKTCQPVHRHLICKESVRFHFSKCGHPGKRYCYQREGQLLCTELVSFKFACGHMIEKACHRDGSKFICNVKCPRKLKCGHPCDKKCGEECIDESCKVCREFRLMEERRKLAEEEKAREHQIAQVKKEIEKIKHSRASDTPSSRKVLHPEGDTAAEYLDVEDRVKKYIQLTHRWFPTVTKIEKVTNNRLYLKWLQCKTLMNDPSHASLKFHGTSKDAVEAIIEGGFRMPNAAGMFGKGVYFATDASKSAQEIYTKHSNMLLLCDVLLGKVLTVDKARPNTNLTELRQKNYDSLFARRDTKRTGGVLFDEFVVYDPAQALPKYIIHYSCTSARMEDVCHDALTANALSKNEFFQVELFPKRSVDLKDPKDVHFRIAESQFLRLMGNSRYSESKRRIRSVEYFVNPTLVRKFEAKQKRAKAKYGTAEESEYILAFHGTPERSAVDSIMQSNFDLTKVVRTAHGHGIYFSEFPDVSLLYGTHLLLCKVLPGRSKKSHAVLGECESIIVDEGPDGRGKMIVIKDVDQILPCYVINLQ